MKYMKKLIKIKNIKIDKWKKQNQSYKIQDKERKD